MKKKILYVHNADFSVLNANKLQVLNMCNGFSQNGFSVNLLSFNSKFVKNYFSNFKSINLKFINLGSLKNLRSIILFYFYLINSKNYDLIYTRDIFFANLVSMFSKKKVFYEIHEFNNSSIWKFFFKRFIRKNSVVSISNGIIKKLKKENIDVKNYVIAPDGIDLNLFDLSLTSLQAKKKLNLSKKVVLYIGSLQKWKGYETYLKSTFKSNDVIFYCIGGNNLENLKLKKKYQNVKFKNFIPQKDLPVWLKAADILILPNSSRYDISKYFTSPLKLFEYMASKTPIISSDLPSIREVVSEEEVLFSKADDHNDLRNKIVYLLNDKSLSTKLSKNSYKKVKKYTWEIRAQSIIKFQNGLK